MNFLRKHFLILALCSGFIANAQPVGFHLGIRAALGQSRFTPVDGLAFHDAIAFEGSITGSLQVTNFFALESGPSFYSLGSKANGAVRDGNDVIGNPRYYYFHDNYRVYGGELPLLIKLSMGDGNFYMKLFAGPSIGFNILGMQSRAFDDPNYDAQHGYFDAPMNDLEVMQFSGIAGFGFDAVSDQGIFGIDFRVHHPFSAMGQLNGQDFSSPAFTVGISYLGD